MMFGRLLAIVVLLGFILPSQPSIIPTTNPNTEHKLYLPLSVNSYPYIEAFTQGYTHVGQTWLNNDCVYGYTTALTTSVVYSVTLAIDVLNQSDYTYVYTDYFSPTLDATLPDQKNPFSHCITSIVTSPYRLGNVKLVSADLSPPIGHVIYPLTVTSWTTNESDISGTVRNDSGHRLADIRVVGILSVDIQDYAYTYEADLESTILNPEEETDFIIEQGVYRRVEDVSEISAQGLAEP